VTICEVDWTFGRAGINGVSTDRVIPEIFFLGHPPGLRSGYHICGSDVQFLS
jgi:hypothetical protein